MKVYVPRICRSYGSLAMRPLEHFLNTSRFDSFNSDSLILYDFDIAARLSHINITQSMILDKLINLKRCSTAPEENKQCAKPLNNPLSLIMQHSMKTGTLLDAWKHMCNSDCHT